MPLGKEIVDVVVREPGATVDIKLWRAGKEEQIKCEYMTTCFYLMKNTQESRY